MLKIVGSLSCLNFRQLMEVYAESNRNNGAERFPDLSQQRQILEVEQDFYQYLAECFFTAPGALYALWEVDGIYASALRLEPYQDGLLLEALETIPAHRRKGYAAALIQAVVDQAADQKIYSHVNKKNVASMRIHEKCGFHKILDYARYADGSVFPDSVTFCTAK